jgi:[ribosomal protein S5]-alanine N-acetyltransferase
VLLGLFIDNWDSPQACKLRVSFVENSLPIHRKIDRAQIVRYKVKMHKEITQPRIETPRLILEKYQSSDVPDIFAYASDPEVTKYVTWDAHKTIEDSKIFFEKIQKITSSQQGRLFFIFGIRLKETGRIIGSIDFKNPNPFCGQIDYALSYKYWSKGLMTEAARGIKDWALSEFPEMVRLQAFCVPANLGSTRVMQKIGLEFEGIRRKSFVIKGTPVDTANYVFVR